MPYFTTSDGTELYYTYPGRSHGIWGDYQRELDQDILDFITK
jgi:hypothetical protein